MDRDRRRGFLSSVRDGELAAVDDFGRQLGCLINALMAAIGALGVIVLVLSGLIIAGVL